VCPFELEYSEFKERENDREGDGYTKECESCDVKRCSWSKKEMIVVKRKCKTESTTKQVFTQQQYHRILPNKLASVRMLLIDTKHGMPVYPRCRLVLYDSIGRGGLGFGRSPPVGEEFRDPSHDDRPLFDCLRGRMRGGNGNNKLAGKAAHREKRNIRERGCCLWVNVWGVGSGR